MKGVERMKTNKELKEIVNQMDIQPRVEKVVEEDRVKVYLNGVIQSEKYWYQEDDERIVTPAFVKESLKDIHEDKLVELYVNSVGGDVYASIEIGNYLKQIPNEIHVVIESIAASGASIISMAGDKIKMFPNSMMMIHQASAMVYGNADELEKIANDLRKFDETVAVSYKKRFKGTDDELMAMIKDETYLTAEDCLSLGLADEIIEEQVEESSEDAKIAVLERFKKENKQEVTNILERFQQKENK